MGGNCWGATHPHATPHKPLVPFALAHQLELRCHPSRDCIVDGGDTTEDCNLETPWGCSHWEGDYQFHDEMADSGVGKAFRSGTGIFQKSPASLCR